MMVFSSAAAMLLVGAATAQILEHRLVVERVCDKFEAVSFDADKSEEWPEIVWRTDPHSPQHPRRERVLASAIAVSTTFESLKLAHEWPAGVMAVDVDAIDFAALHAAAPATVSALAWLTTLAAQRVTLVSALDANIPVGSFTAANATRPSWKQVVETCGLLIQVMPELALKPCHPPRASFGSAKHTSGSAVLDLAAAALIAPGVILRNGRLGPAALDKRDSELYSPATRWDDPSLTLFSATTATPRASSGMGAAATSELVHDSRGSQAYGVLWGMGTLSHTAALWNVSRIVAISVTSDERPDVELLPCVPNDPNAFARFTTVIPGATPFEAHIITTVVSQASVRLLDAFLSSDHSSLQTAVAPDNVAQPESQEFSDRSTRVRVAPLGEASNMRIAAPWTMPPRMSYIGAQLRGSLCRTVDRTGLHRDLSYSLHVPISTASGSPLDSHHPTSHQHTAPHCHLAIVQRMDSSSYFDLDEVREDARRGGASIRGFSRYIDIERPTSTSTQHVVVFSLPITSSEAQAIGTISSGTEGSTHATLHSHEAGSTLTLDARLNQLLHMRYQSSGCHNRQGSASGNNTSGGDGTVFVGPNTDWPLATHRPAFSGCYAFAHLPQATAHVMCTPGGLSINSASSDEMLSLRALAAAIGGDAVAADDAFAASGEWAVIIPAGASSSAQSSPDFNGSCTPVLAPMPVGNIDEMRIVGLVTALSASLGACILAWAAFATPAGKQAWQSLALGGSQHTSLPHAAASVSDTGDTRTSATGAPHQTHNGTPTPGIVADERTDLAAPATIKHISPRQRGATTTTGTRKRAGSVRRKEASELE